MKCALCGVEWKEPFDYMALIHELNGCALAGCSVLSIDAPKINAAIEAARKECKEK